MFERNTLVSGGQGGPARSTFEAHLSSAETFSPAGGRLLPTCQSRPPHPPGEAHDDRARCGWALPPEIHSAQLRQRPGGPVACSPRAGTWSSLERHLRVGGLTNSSTCWGRCRPGRGRGRRPERYVAGARALPGVADAGPASTARKRAVQQETAATAYATGPWPRMPTLAETGPPNHTNPRGIAGDELLRDQTPSRIAVNEADYARDVGPGRHHDGHLPVWYPAAGGGQRHRTPMRPPAIRETPPHGG